MKDKVILGYLSMRDAWFESGFDSDALEFIKEHVGEIKCRGMSCQDASYEWFSLLKDGGFDVELHHGMYYLDDDPENAEGHTWLVVEGRIFDPTASQFDGRRVLDRYETHEIED